MEIWFFLHIKLTTIYRCNYKLEKIAKYCKQKEGINVSPVQIASALIHTDVARIDISKIEDKDRRCFKK